VDTTAGSALVTGYFTGQELKICSSFCSWITQLTPAVFSPALPA